MSNFRLFLSLFCRNVDDFLSPQINRTSSEVTLMEFTRK